MSFHITSRTPAANYATVSYTLPIGVCNTLVAHPMESAMALEEFAKNVEEYSNVGVFNRFKPTDSAAQHVSDIERMLVGDIAATRTKSMLEQAQDTISGPRQTDYGDKLTNFSQISMLWQGMLAPKLLPDSRITPEDVALLMMLVKMSRLAKSPDHYDSILDIAGYAGCYDHIQKERAAGRTLPGALRDARASE